MIYFIQAEHGGPIKIGWTEGRPNPKYGDIFLERRRKSLQTGNPYPLVVRHVIAGERLEEMVLHSVFQEHRLMGEWFEPVPYLEGLANGELENYELEALRELERL